MASSPPLPSSSAVANKQKEEVTDAEFHFSVHGFNKEEEEMEDEKEAMVAADQLFFNGHLLPLYHHHSHYQAYPWHLPHQPNMAPPTSTTTESGPADQNTVTNIPPSCSSSSSSSLQTAQTADPCHSKWKHIFSFKPKKSRLIADRNDASCLPAKPRAIKSGRRSLDGMSMSSASRAFMSSASFVKGRCSDFSRDSLSSSSLASCSALIVIKKTEERLSLRDVLCSSSNGVPEKSSSCYSASVRVAPVVSVPLHFINSKRKNGINIFDLFSSSRKNSINSHQQNINPRLSVNNI